MFKNLIYFDSNKVSDYKALLEGKKHIDIKKMKITSNKSAGAKFHVFSGDIGANSEMEGEVRENLLLDCNEFESLLEAKGGDNYYNLMQDDYDINTIPTTSIISFRATIGIPEEFDMMELINRFKPMLVSSMGLPSEEEEIFKSVFAKDSTKIPLYIQSDNFENRIGFSKMNSQNLCCEIENLEDYEGEEVTIVAKINSRKTYINKPLIVFDVFKDLFSINRALRRTFESTEIEGVENVKVEQDLLNLELLSIYQ